jgi:membrane protein involved in D-alanine export
LEIATVTARFPDRSRHRAGTDVPRLSLQIYSRSLDQAFLGRSGNRWFFRPNTGLHVWLQPLPFFDFAGYSAFAIAFSRLFGIRTPENFDRPFLAHNIREFWNRWHITLSFWFRDHVYMRFLLTAIKGRWFKNDQIGSYLGFFLSFGLMGLWHGAAVHYLIYGCYHAGLFTGHDLFLRWNKKSQWWGTGPLWRFTSILVTANLVCFGFLIFSGRLG